MRIHLVLAVSVSAAIVMLAGYALGYRDGSPVTIEVVPPSDCTPVEELEPPMF